MKSWVSTPRAQWKHESHHTHPHNEEKAEQIPSSSPRRAEVIGQTAAPNGGWVV